MSYRVEGFTFETEEEARLAGKEAEGIKYIQAQNNINDPDIAFRLYNRLIEKNIFTTPVGISFLGEMRRYLMTVPRVNKAALKPLPVYRQRAQEERKPQTGQPRESRPRQTAQVSAVAPGARATAQRRRRRRRDYYRPFQISTFFAIVFALALIGVFIITAVSTNNITILNYENKLIDRYEEWEQDLLRRENELKEREKKQQMQEDGLWTN